VFLRFPREHWHRIRHTNLIERTFGETRRRTKVIGRLPGERSCLSLVWAVLDRASRGWRGVTQTPAGSGSSKTSAATCGYRRTGNLTRR
jgi:putative transposase